MILQTAAACEDWHNRHFRDLEIERLELDEQWPYVHTHRERMTKQDKVEHPDRGDCWLWAALDPKSKAVIQRQTGKPKANAAKAFALSLASHIAGRVNHERPAQQLRVWHCRRVR